MKAIVRIVPKALTIDLDIVEVGDMERTLTQNQGYVDGDSRKLVVFGKKVD